MDNPYRPLESTEPISLRDEIAWSLEEYARVRKEHLHYERTVQDLGLLCMVMGGFVLIMSLVTMSCGVMVLLGKLQWAGTQNEYPPRIEPWELQVQGMMWTGISLLVVLVSFATIQMGRHFRRLDPQGKEYAVPLMFILAVLAFPVTTVVAAYLCYILYSKKGRAVFSATYLDVIHRTPHIEHHSSHGITWIFLIAFMIFSTWAVLGLIITGFKPPIG
jgi:hypothetical protein